MPTVSASWHEEFGEVPPIGHVLRVELPHRWLRIHSLPDAKRYPTTELERQALLARHNQVATHVLGTGGVTLYVRSHDPQSSGQLQRQYPELSLEVVPDLEYRDQDAEVTFRFLAADLAWVPSCYDRLLLGVAEDEVPSVVFHSPTSKFVYAPYDGGADIFTPTVADTARLRAKWRNWLPANQEGL